MSVTKIDLQYFLEKSKSVSLTAEELEEQRRSFAYGNTRIENKRITRRMIDEQADGLKKTT